MEKQFCGSFLLFMFHVCLFYAGLSNESSGSAVECFIRDRWVAGSRLTGVTALCPRARHIDACLVQPRKTRLDITEKL